MTGAAPLVAAAAVATLLLSAAGASAAPSGEALEQARAISRGRALAVAHCGICHAVGESGHSPNVQAPPFRSLHTVYPVADLVDAIAQGAATGHPAMPQFRFSFEQGRDLVRYVRSIQEHPSPAETKPD